MVQFNAQLDGQFITPDELVDIPVNVPLRVTIEPARVEQSSIVDWQSLLDLAEQHDHYAHGKD